VNLGQTYRGGTEDCRRNVLSVLIQLIGLSSKSTNLSQTELTYRHLPLFMQAYILREEIYSSQAKNFKSLSTVRKTKKKASDRLNISGSLQQNRRSHSYY